MTETNKDTDDDDAAERAVAVDVAMKMADKFQAEHGRLPNTDIEFSGMLAIAFLLGRESK